MANPLQIVKNASKLISQAIVKRDKEFERTAKTILKAVVSELNTTLKGKPLQDMLPLETFEDIEFDTPHLLMAVDNHHNKLALPGGSYIVAESLRIKSITWDGQWVPLSPRDASHRPYQFDLRVTFEKGIEEDMECVIHLG